MKLKSRKAFICYLYFGLSSTLQAAEPNPKLEKAALEIISAIEAADPATTSRRAAWQPVHDALVTSIKTAESEAGLLLSFSRILEHWDGKVFRLLDRSQAQFWALQQKTPLFPDYGAWFQARGLKWTVQYPGQNGLKIFRRGDEVKKTAFDPYHIGDKRTELVLEVQNNPLSPMRKLKAKLNLIPFAEYVLKETQASASRLTLGKKHSCAQKLWFWLNETVSAHILSKLNYHSETCEGQLLDLRDGFGPEPAGAIKLNRKIPTVVLINQQTREGAARFALHLQKQGDHVIGEASGTPLLPEKELKLSQSSLSVLVYNADVEGIQPDQGMKDSFLYAEGLDDIKEAGMLWLKQRISQNELDTSK